MSRNNRNRKKHISKQLVENHQTVYIFEAEDLLKEANHLRGNLGIGVRGDYFMGMDNASGAVVSLDLVTATEIIKELGLKGEAYLKNGPHGKQYIIFKGYPGIRNIITGTRYLASNPKVVDMAIGKLGVQKSVIQGTSITIVLYVGINLLEFFLNDDATKSMLFGKLASDMTKAVISGCMAAIFGSAITGITAIAFAPLLVAIIVGVVVGAVLNEIDTRYRLTETLIKAIEQTSNDIEYGIWKFFDDFERELEWRIENQIPF